MAANTPHSLATEHVPMFVSGPGETDVFFIVVVIIAIMAILLVGVLYLTLHALPEKMAHKINHSQLLLIGVMSLVALFMHNNYFFIAALLLAAVRLPDWTTSFKSIAKSLEEQAEGKRDEDPADSHQQVDLPMVAPPPDSSALAEQVKGN